MSLKVGDKFPEGVKLQYVKLSSDDTDSLSCSVPVGYDLSKEAQSKKILIVSFPGAFTPTCSQEHIPEYLKEDNLKNLVNKGIDEIIFLSANDAFVLQAFAKAYKVEQNEFERNHVIFASDPLASFSKNIGFSLDLKSLGLGLRTGRYAIVVNHGKIDYIGNEPGSDVTVSGYKSVVKSLK